MKTVLPSASRGRTELGWLDSRHSFSFGQYYDPARPGFRSLRVINDDVVAPAAGFGMHPHRDMEIITVVLEGALEHRDSLGHHGVIRSGEVQAIHAGKGIAHSEFNASKTEPVHFLQIWIEPRLRGGPPAYAQGTVPAADLTGLTVVAGPKGSGAPLEIEQDATLARGRVRTGETIQRPLAQDRAAWIQVTSGTLRAGMETLRAGDALALENEAALELTAVETAEFLFFDLP